MRSRRDWLYIIVLFIFYASIHEIIAYSGIFMDWQEWNRLFVVLRLFPYMISSIIVYLLLCRQYNPIVFMLVHADILILSTGFFVYEDKQEYIYLVIIWCLLRYGYISVILNSVYFRQMLETIVALGINEAWIWFIVYGVGGYILIIGQMFVIHILTHICVRSIYKLLGCEFSCQ